MPETKRRIRPVIEEIVEEKPKVKEEVVTSPPEMPKKREEAEHIHKAHTHHEQPVYMPEPASEVTHDHAKELLAEITSSHTETQTDRMNMKLLFGITIVTALVVGFISGGVYVYVTGVRPDSTVATPTPTSSPIASTTPVATATATPVAVSPDVLSSFKVSVLNGSGQIGGAGKVKSLMENAGFKVGSTGNAGSFNYTDTMIQTTDKVSAEVIAVLKKALSKDYSVEVGKALPTDSKWDIVVTVGSK